MVSLFTIDIYKGRKQKAAVFDVTSPLDIQIPQYGFDILDSTLEAS